MHQRLDDESWFEWWSGQSRLTYQGCCFELMEKNLFVVPNGVNTAFPFVGY